MLTYRAYGEPNKRIPILILHGLLGSKENWHTQAEKLAQHDHHVFTIDLRNHGQSPHLSGMSYQDMAKDVFDLADHLGIAQFKLIGHSMGGKVAMRMAFLQAHRVERLVVVDIAPKKYPLHHQSILAGMMHFPMHKLQDRQQANEWLKKVVADDFHRAFLLKNLRKDYDTKQYYWQCHLSEIARQYLKIADFPIQADYHYNGKTCFIRGGNSDYIQTDDLPTIDKLFIDNEVITIPHAAHTPHMEQAERFFDAMSSFMRS